MDGTRSELRRAGARDPRRPRRSLAARACVPGRAVAFLSSRARRFVETLVAIWRAGGLAVPLSPLHAAPELAHVVADAAPAVVVASRALAPRLAGRARAPTTGRRSLRAEDAGDVSATPAANARCRIRDARDADGLMLYTSGTTGRPKGVRLSHAALAATVSSLEEAWRWRRDDRLLHVLPLHHTHGLIVALLGALWVGRRGRASCRSPPPRSGTRSPAPACSWRCRRSTPS